MHLELEKLEESVLLSGADPISLLSALPAQADPIQLENVAGAAGVANGGSGNSATFFDYDSDGNLDLYFVNDPGAGGLYHSDGTGGFANVTATAGVTGSGNDLVAGDYDNDGWIDVAVVLGSRDFTLYHNQGDGTFLNVTAGLGIPQICGIRWTLSTMTTMAASTCTS